MSKTDNTRPYAVQEQDTANDGFVHHACTRRRGASRKWRQNRSQPRMVYFTISSLSLLTKTNRAMLPMKVRLHHECASDGTTRDLLSVMRRPNTTTAKLVSQLEAVFGSVTLVTNRLGGDIATLECNDRCIRQLWHYGGENYVHGHARDERKLRQRRFRRRNHASLYEARHGLVDEFDLLPIREDKRTIIFDLT